VVIVERKFLVFDIRCVYFVDYPCEAQGGDAVIIFGCKNKVQDNNFKFTQVNHTSVLDLTQDLDTLWGKMDRTCRYKIRRAEREQIQVKINQDYEAFYRISLQFQKEKGFGSIFGLRHPDLTTIRERATLFTMYYRDELLGGHVYLEDQDNILMWISASQRLHVDKEKAALISRANRLLHWEAIKYAQEKGIKEYDLGGIFPDEIASRDPGKQNENFFKLSFGGQTVQRYQYEKSYSVFHHLCRRLYIVASPLIGRSPSTTG
jgi:hypothetical protein